MIDAESPLPSLFGEGPGVGSNAGCGIIKEIMAECLCELFLDRTDIPEADGDSVMEGPVPGRFKVLPHSGQLGGIAEIGVEEKTVGRPERLQSPP